MTNFLGYKGIGKQHRAISAMRRVSTKFITNAFQGANIEKIKLNTELKKLSNKFLNYLV